MTVINPQLCLRLFFAWLFVSFVSILPFTASANNLVISGGARLAAPNADKVSFSVSWQNSWHVGGTPGNHDAVWLFIKFRECGAGGGWTHALLDTVMANHSVSATATFARPVRLEDRNGTIPSGATVTNGLGHNTGALIRRASLGVGHMSGVQCTLRIVNPSFDPTKVYDIRVFGIEMVQVINEPYFLGDGGSTNSFNLMTVSSETASFGAGVLFTGSPEVNASFPKGVAEFYCMKYEITQGQYANFLNTSQAMAGSPILWSGINRNTLQSGGVSPNDVFATAPDRAQNFLSWPDLLAYLDWAALRPMTEMEYEKVCKGPSAGVTGMYAWGNGTRIRAWFVSGTEDGTETVVTNNANCNFMFTFVTTDGHNPPGLPTLQLNANGTSFYNGFTQAQNGSVLTNTIHPPITFPGGSGCCNAHLRTTPIIMAGTNASLGFGPLSVGIFARDATTTRTQTGAAYYGAMEMSGNVWEQCVSVTNGTTYDGVWGDGYLDASGQANTVNWPGGTGTGGTFTNRALRGGGYDSPWELCRVADRQFWNNTDLTRNGTVTPPNYTGVWRLDNGPDSATSRRGAFGGRGVR